MDKYIMEVDWKGKKDRNIDMLGDDELVLEYMNDKGFKRVKGSTFLFKRGNRILYVSAVMSGDVHEPKPKINEYYNTFKL